MHPPMRKLGVRLLTNNGWVVGTMHIPEESSFRSFLNRNEPFFRLTDASLAAQPRMLPFLALQRSAVVLLVPGEDVEHARHEVHHADRLHEVACLFDGGLLMGTLGLAGGVRVSDHLMRTHGFFVLTDCTIAVEPNAEAIVEPEPLVYVQASRVVGLAEFD